jgi:hypothetical protein
MVGLACGLAVYTPIRHLLTAPDIALVAAAREADFASDPATLARARNYESHVLASVAAVKAWPEVREATSGARAGWEVSLRLGRGLDR